MKSRVFFATSGLVGTNAGATSRRGLGMGDTYLAITPGTFEIWRAAGRLSNLFVKIALNSLDVTATIAILKNGSAGNQSISVGAGLTGEFYDSVNHDTVASGDSLIALLTSSAGTGTIFIGALGVVFTATTNLSVYVATLGLSRLSDGAGADVFSAPGVTDRVTTEANAQIRIPSAGVMKNLFWRFTANTNSSAETVISRINGVDGALSLSIPATTTGNFEDITNSDTLAANDLYGLRITRTGASGAAWGGGALTTNFESTDGFFFFGGGVVSGQLLSDGLTRYFLNFEPRTLEADQQYRLFNSHTFDKLRLYILTNAATSPSTFDLRKNEASTALTISIGAGLTGAFTDDTNSVSGIAGDRIIMRSVNGGGGSLTYGSYTMRVEAAAGAILLPPQFGFHPLNMI